MKLPQQRNSTKLQYKGKEPHAIRKKTSAMSSNIALDNSVELFFCLRTACRLSFSGGAAVDKKSPFSHMSQPKVGMALFFWRSKKKSRSPRTETIYKKLKEKSTRALVTTHDSENTGRNKNYNTQAQGSVADQPMMEPFFGVDVAVTATI
jgi:hypothetical protein